MYEEKETKSRSEVETARGKAEGKPKDEETSAEGAVAGGGLLVKGQRQMLEAGGSVFQWFSGSNERRQHSYGLQHAA